MPEITVVHIVIIVVALVIGAVIGWIIRSNRATSEKIAVNDGWQEQLDTQRSEHERLLEQNKSLMALNSQYQASDKDAKMRASELSSALREAFQRRDELQRLLKDIRGDLENAVSERDQLLTKASAIDEFLGQLEQKDAQIDKLSAELKNWHERLPPLIDRYQQRDIEAKVFEKQLDDARERIAGLEEMIGSEQTRVDPVDADTLDDDMDASNQCIEDDTPVEEIFEKFDEASDDDVGELNDIARDDLKLIKGVGPAIEKTLNEMGISRFDQIAQMSEYDIDRVAHRLKGFRSRIYREDWIGQARDLHNEKAGGQQ